MMRVLLSLLFFVAMTPWFWLEFVARDAASETLRTALFCVGMACMIALAALDRRREAKG